jgi:heterodisulfide reductase subunit A-like polyferredoxin
MEYEKLSDESKEKQPDIEGKPVTGAVLVVGGGIAGIQASLDMAESGYRVYLVENDSAIGGKMAQLDKTFPTNDCAMCIVSPKLVETGRHANIDLMMLTEVKEVTGGPGNFTVKLLEKPRFIDLEKCTACGECAKVCPIELPNKFDEGLCTKKAAYKLYPQAMPGAFAIEKKGAAPCKAECPVHVSVQGWIALMNKGRFQDAIALFKDAHPFPGICGRVCHHPCESACTRKNVDQSMGIQHLHRYLADWDRKSDAPYLPVKKEARNEKVVVIGSGPAGLACAYFLAIEGFAVTVFEKQDVLGGMLTLGIPEYRLPRDIIESEIQTIRNLGVEFRTGVDIGRNLTIGQLRSQGYKAFFMAIGAQGCKALGVAGEDLEGVVPGVDYLRQINLGQKVHLGDRVAVVGGGNVAMDAVRTALRTGSKKPFVIYRRSESEMPALPEEIAECREEGIEIMTLANPVRIIGENGKVTGLECVKMQLGEPDASGRRRPIPIPGSEFIREVDAVIPAIGQESDWTCLTDESDCKLNNQGTMMVDRTTLQTDAPDVFSGGDAVTGPATVVEAIEAGKQAAISITRFVTGADLREGRERIYEVVTDVPLEGLERRPRQKMSHLSAEQRVQSFNEVQLGYDDESAKTEAGRCLECGLCSECYQCEKACLAGAIDHDCLPREKEIKVGAIILAPGFALGSPTSNSEYGYGRYPNVVSSLEFERMLSASGPYEGHLVRLSDKQTPRKIAFIQCTGSRDARHASYCSSVCCMYAMKQAVIAKEHTPGLDTSIFYMDLRAFGKEFEEYHVRAQDEYGVQFVRSRVASLQEIPGGNLLLRYENGNLAKEEIFDLVVLSVGLAHPKESESMARVFGFELNEHGFASTDMLTPLETTRPGVFVCGAFSGPKDIPDTVAQASGAAVKAAGLIAGARGTLVSARQLPAERDVIGKTPRIGVFICHCGINIGGVINVPAVTEYVKTLPGVCFADNNLYTCSQDTQQRIKSMIEEHDLNRVIVASCTPRTHEPLFKETLSEAGLNPYLLEFVNIRDQCSWVHMQEPEAATKKAKDLLRMGIAKSAWLRPLTRVKVGVTPVALVIGGGLAGMTAALEIGHQGFDVHLVEKSNDLGGNLNRLFRFIDGSDPRARVKSLAGELESNKHIHVYTGAQVKAIDGYIGNYSSMISLADDRKIKIDHGAVVVATGGTQLTPDEYLYGDDSRVLTQLELEERLATGNVEAKRVVMIGCVGSRQEGRPYCSRLCCTQAIKNSLEIKRLSPETEVFVLNRDIRVYGFKESYYTEAREKGVRFIRYEVEHKPVVATEDGLLTVTCLECSIGEELILNADLVVLNVPVVPGETNEKLAQLLKVPLNKDGFFLEAHMKLRPVEFATDGVFLCGLAHAPKLADESISQACGAAAKACTVLAKSFLEGEGMIARVNESLCSGCGLCVELCPYGAISLKDSDGTSSVNPALCKCCGACAGGCRMGAIQQSGLGDRELIEVLDAAFWEERKDACC